MTNTAPRPEPVAGERSIDPSVARMREISRSVAFDPGWWTPEVAEEVRAVFDSRAPGWADHESVDYRAPLAAALDSVAFSGGTCLDVGSGTAIQEVTLLGRFDHVVAVELSPEMLAHAHRECAAFVRADASRLPILGGAASAVVLVNMFLFVAEATRVLSPDGALVYVSTWGAETPIYLDPSDVAAAMTTLGDSSFVATTGTIGKSCWTVVRRQGTRRDKGDR